MRSRTRVRPPNQASVEVACCGESHRVVVEGAAIRLVDHSRDDDELILDVLGAPGAVACLQVRRAWRGGWIDGVPKQLEPLVALRWGDAGVRRGAVRLFVGGLDNPLPIDADYFGPLSPQVNASLWVYALAHRPTPEELNAFRQAGVATGSDAAALADATGRALTLRAVSDLRRRGLDDPLDARLWVKALGHLPSPAEKDAFGAVGVADGFTALCWAELLAAPITVPTIRRRRDEGIDDPAPLVAAMFDA